MVDGRDAASRGLGASASRLGRRHDVSGLRASPGGGGGGGASLLDGGVKRPQARQAVQEGGAGDARQRPRGAEELRVVRLDRLVAAGRRRGEELAPAQVDQDALHGAQVGARAQEAPRAVRVPHLLPLPAPRQSHRVHGAHPARVPGEKSARRRRHEGHQGRDDAAARLPGYLTYTITMNISSYCITVFLLTFSDRSKAEIINCRRFKEIINAITSW